MNAERAREFLLKLPHVIEVEQWGGLIYCLGDKAIGGKMFVMLNLEPGAGKPISYPVGEERFGEMCERDGLVPAPYFARIFWISADRWDALRDREWEQELTAAHGLTFDKLPPKTKSVLAMPNAEQKRIVAERRKVLAAKEAQKKATKAPMKPPAPPQTTRES